MRQQVIVLGFEISERAEDKMWEHGITVEQMEQTLDNPYRVVRNRASGSAPYLFIGQDHGGACIAAPIFPTDDPTIWAPITAWYCKPQEWAQLPPLH